MSGTNFSDGAISKGGTIDTYLANPAGHTILCRSTVANIPSAMAGYAVGCILQATDTGNNYINTGTTSSSTFTLLDAGTAFGLPTSASDASSTTGNSFLLTESSLTTGVGIKVLGTTANFTTGGALFKADLAAAVAGNGFVGVTTGAYTGTGLLSLSATGQTSGTVSLLTGGGANLLTSGIIESIVMGAATVGAGLKISNTGAYTDTSSAILSIVASTASTTGNVLGIATISSRAVMIGQALATPVFQIDSSTSSQIAGLKLTGAVTGGTVALAAIDSGSAASLTIDGKGAGTVGIGNTSTGEVSLSRGARKSLIVGGTVTTGNAQNVTPTAAQLLGGQYKHTTQTAGGTFTLDTGTNISSAVTGVAVGDTFTCLYINNGNQTGTITTAASGTTLFGTAAVAASKTALLTFSNTGSNAWDVYITVSA